MVRFKSNFRRLSVVAVLLCSISTGAIGQVATFDAAAVAKMAEQIKQSAEQVKQLQAQLKEMTDLNKALSGITEGANLDGLLSNETVSNALPDNYDDYLKMIHGGGGNAGKYAEAAKKANEFVLQSIEGQGSLDEQKTFYDKVLERQKDVAAGGMGTSQAIYEASIEISKEITSLSKKLSQAKDPKTVMDYQSQLSALQARLSSEQLKLDAVSMSQAAELQSLENQAEDLQRQKNRALAERSRKISGVK